MSEQNTEFEKWLDDTVLVGNPDTVAEWAWSAATAEANKRIAELESEVAKANEVNSMLTDSLILRNNKITEFQAHINTLREALKLYKGVLIVANKFGKLSVTNELLKIEEALSATPAESPQAHDDELLEKVISTIESLNVDAMFKPVSFSDMFVAIRNLKGNT